ncbi:MAG: accessory factor UbiK family protein [Rhodospirillales bacterium]|nr:accessory factor UbiK family protein [Rhodospirillales bacterium]
MNTRKRIVEDLARVAGGALGTLAGLKAEMEAFVKERLEKIIADLDLVRRDEFEAVAEMAALAREQQEKLESRLAELEARLNGAKPETAAPKTPRRRGVRTP